MKKLLHIQDGVIVKVSGLRELPRSGRTTEIVEDTDPRVLDWTAKVEAATASANELKAKAEAEAAALELSKVNAVTDIQACTTIAGLRSCMLKLEERLRKAGI